MRTQTDGVVKTFDVDPGTIIFIPARMDHRFYDVIQRLAVLVFFGPAEGSTAPAAP
jgi:hypothetical protein